VTEWIGGKIGIRRHSAFAFLDVALLPKQLKIYPAGRGCWIKNDGAGNVAGRAISPLIKSSMAESFFPATAPRAAAAQAGQQRQTTTKPRNENRRGTPPRGGDPGQRNISPKHLLTDRLDGAQVICIPAKNDPDSRDGKRPAAAISRFLGPAGPRYWPAIIRRSRSANLWLC